ncbi:hypothetical protein GK047_00090 [Paenibacillus sp. SYP-B3998]|uniref:Uncharacterized protein n=2 Tax=Paenibacillus sp. SYP-B3998 TaxID=2678564 RepID=A0A6G3ZRT6_9BACL|nr:hypothetical protein [Paenibacillus sp. SYP-B3998]
MTTNLPEGTECISVSQGTVNWNRKRKVAPHQWQISYSKNQTMGAGLVAGGMQAKGEIILFWNSESTPRPELILPYTEAIRDGASVVMTKPVGICEKNLNGARLSAITLNRMLKRPDLGAASLSIGPFAITRQALSSIGNRLLAVPPKFLVACLQGELPIKTISVRRLDTSKAVPDETTVIQETMQAISEWIRFKGERGGFTDMKRARDLFKPKDGGVR